MLIVLDERQLNAGSADVSSAQMPSMLVLSYNQIIKRCSRFALSADEPSALPAMRYVKLKVDDPDPDS